MLIKRPEIKIVEKIVVVKNETIVIEDTGEKCTAFIKSFSTFGELRIKFSTRMKTAFNLTLLNSTYLDLYVIPA